MWRRDVDAHTRVHDKAAWFWLRVFLFVSAEDIRDLKNFKTVLRERHYNSLGFKTLWATETQLLDCHENIPLVVLSGWLLQT